MFGFKRRRLTKKLFEFLRPTVGVVEIHFGEIPQGYWQDPYILGYLTGVFNNMFPFMAGGVGKVSDQTRALVMIDVFAALYGNEDVVGLFTDPQTTENQEFIRGTNNAQKFLSLALGLNDSLDDPDVVEAKKRMEATPEVLKPPEIYEGITAGQELAASFQDMVYTDYIRDHFW